MTHTISQYRACVCPQLKHVEIIKFWATNTNDISMDSQPKVMFTLKISDLYLLAFSRKLTKSVFYVDILKHVEIIKF